MRQFALRCVLLCDFNKCMLLLQLTDLCASLTTLCLRFLSNSRLFFSILRVKSLSSNLFYFFLLFAKERTRWDAPWQHSSMEADNFFFFFDRRFLGKHKWFSAQKMTWATAWEDKLSYKNGAFLFQMWWNDWMSEFVCARQMTWQSCNWMIMWICLSERWEVKVWTQKSLCAAAALSQHVHLQSPFWESCLIWCELFSGSI